MNTSEGKRLFLDQTNASHKQNMYPTIDMTDGGKELFFRRTAKEFYDKSNIVYKPPPVSKVFPKRHSFVHNCVANKNKINLDHFDDIYNKKVFN